MKIFPSPSRNKRQTSALCVLFITSRLHDRRVGCDRLVLNVSSNVLGISDDSCVLHVDEDVCTTDICVWAFLYALYT